MKRILGSIISNIATLLLSLILALIVWAVAVRANDPIITKSLQLDIVTRGILPAEGDVSLDDDVVRITFEGPESAVDPLTNNDFTAFVDISDAAFGASEQPVLIELIEPPLDLVFQEPISTTLVVEQIVSREIPVSLQIRGDAARGHSAGEPIIDPAMIVVTGPADRVNQLLEAQITVFLDDPREDLVVVRRPTFYDTESRVVGVSGLATSNEEVQVSIPISEIEGVADKPVIVNWVGSPAPGYRLLDVQIEPDRVLVTGPPGILDGTRSIETEQIDISGLNESFTYEVTLALPDGVELDEVEPVFVTIEIDPIYTASVVRRQIEIRALADPLTATIQPADVSVFLFGPLPALESITDVDVSVTLDLLDLPVGEYSLQPIVNVTANDVEIRSIQPAEISVTIEEIPVEEPLLPDDVIDPADESILTPAAPTDDEESTGEDAATDDEPSFESDNENETPSDADSGTATPTVTPIPVATPTPGSYP